MQTHVQVPFADHRGGSLYRVYFGTRDSEVRSRVGWFEIDLEAPTRILRVSEQPSLDLGERGCFDDNGVTPSWIVNRGSEKYLYYFGWNRGTTVAFHVFSGLAISRDGGDSFERIQRTPILDRRPNDPFLATAPCVLKSDREWRVWYASGEDYDIFDKGTYYPRYRIKTGSSKDGIEWERSGEICIDFESSDEYAITRPCVRADKGEYEMWYSTKGGGLPDGVCPFERRSTLATTRRSGWYRSIGGWMGFGDDRVCPHFQSWRSGLHVI